MTLSELSIFYPPGNPKRILVYFVDALDAHEHCNELLDQMEAEVLGYLE